TPVAASLMVVVYLRRPWTVGALYRAQVVHWVNAQNRAAQPASMPRIPAATADQPAATPGIRLARETAITPHKSTSTPTQNPTHNMTSARTWPPNMAWGSFERRVRRKSASVPASAMTNQHSPNVRAAFAHRDAIAAAMV